MKSKFQGISVGKKDISALNKYLTSNSLWILKNLTIIWRLILAKLRNYLLCTPTSHFGDNFCFIILSGGKAKLILKYRGVNTPCFQAPISIHSNPPITVNCCLMCSNTNSRLSGPENITNPVKKSFQFWRTWASVVIEPPDEYILSRRYSWIPLLWPVRNDFANECLEQQVILPRCRRIPFVWNDFT